MRIPVGIRPSFPEEISFFLHNYLQGMVRIIPVQKWYHAVRDKIRPGLT